MIGSVSREKGQKREEDELVESECISFISRVGMLWNSQNRVTLSVVIVSRE